MVQVLLHFLKLSLPGPWQMPLQVASSTSPEAPRKRKRRKKTHNSEFEASQEEPVGSEVQLPSREKVEDNLERYMDKLSMWQLMISTSDLGSVGKPVRKEAEKSWPVKFSEDVVGPLYV